MRTWNDINPSTIIEVNSKNRRETTQTSIHCFFLFTSQTRAKNTQRPAMEANNSPQQPSPLPPTYPELSYTTIPLNTPATKIRLLELFPSADFSSPLYCRLYTTPIASPAPFKALSYAWGSDDKTHLIHVESNNASGSDDKTDRACIDLSNTNGTEKNSFFHSLITLFTTYSTRCCFGSDDDTTVASVVNGSSDVEVHGDGAMSGGHGEERGESDVGGSGTTSSTVGITSSLDSCLRHLRAIHHRDHLPHNNSHPPPNPHHHMSPPVPPLTLWIDQLCINQSDSDEKAVQVGLMSQIYSRAERVLVWLGPEADGSDEVMDVLAELWRESLSTGIRLGVKEWFTKLANDFCRASDEDSGVDLLDLGVGVADTEALDGAAAVCTTNKEADASTGKTVMAVVEDGAAKFHRLVVSDELQAFFRRPWFTRLWVVQEACHCSDTVLVCGTKPPVSYDILGPIALFATYVVRTLLIKRRYMLEWDSVSDSSFNADIAGFEVSCSKNVARVIGDLASYTTPLYNTRLDTIRQVSKGEGGSNLFTLLVDMYESGNLCRETKLYRDRVYALLGLAVDVDELEIKPDYSSQKSTAQILTEVAKAIVRKTKRDFPVELLFFSQFPKTTLDDGSDEQLPSWVPDWRFGLRNPFYIRSGKGDTYMACGPHRSVDRVPTITAGVLGLRGYLVDTIEEVVGTSTRNRWRESIEFFEKWDKLWELSKQKTKPIYKTPARREEALWRVPVRDLAQSWQKDAMRSTRAKAGFALEYKRWRRTLERYKAMDCNITTPGWADGVDEDEKKKATEWVAHEEREEGGKWYYTAMREMAGKRLYLTKEGYMGMGPSAMQPGDVVVVFPGARVPFVLRPTSEDNTFTYLGDAYCDGIMDGEITLREERRDFFLV